MSIKLAKNEYADFVRASTPKLIQKRKVDIDFDDYTISMFSVLMW